MPRSVVTGGAGFIGSHMVDLLLAEGHAVHVVDDLSTGRISNLAEAVGNTSLQIHEVDILQLTHDHVAFRGADYVFHFAGIGDIVPSIENPCRYLEVNVQGTVKVLEAARFAKVRKVLYAASSSCYGLTGGPTAENGKIDPQYPYALSKYLGEQCAIHWSRTYGLAADSLRIFSAYGPRVGTKGAYGAVFGVFLKQKLEGMPLTVVGDGSQRRDWVHVRDVARAFLAAAQNVQYGRVFNVGTGTPRSVSSLTEILGGPVVFVPKRPGEPDVTWADISKTVTTLGWVPREDFVASVQEMIDRIEDWRETPLWSEETIDIATRSWFENLGRDKSA
jgi:UDP-glucose 4-epimerase